MRFAAVASSCLVASAIALAACAHSQKTHKRPVDPCPDSQSCLSDPACNFDESRQCEMCRCTAPPYVPPQVLDPRSPPQ